MPRHRTSFAIPAAALVTAAALAACGSSGSSSSGTSGGAAAGGAYGSAPASTTTTAAATPPASSGSGSELKISADPNGALKFDKSTLTAKSGKVTITMQNPSGSGLPHAVAVEGNGVDKDGETAQPGGTSTVTVDLKPGTYTFYCPVDGHKQAGMEGKLTVT